MKNVQGGGQGEGEGSYLNGFGYFSPFHALSVGSLVALGEFQSVTSAFVSMHFGEEDTLAWRAWLCPKS